MTTKYKELLKQKQEKLAEELQRIQPPQTKEGNLQWFHYHQNNSGGSFVVDDDVTNDVYIQASSIAEANQKAFNLGIYFNGVELGQDCGCCGDRWYEPYEAEEFPKTVTCNLKTAEESKLNFKEADYSWGDKEYEVTCETIEQYVEITTKSNMFRLYTSIYLYYADGTKKVFNYDK